MILMPSGSRNANLIVFAEYQLDAKFPRRPASESQARSPSNLFVHKTGWRVLP